MRNELSSLKAIWSLPQNFTRLTENYSQSQPEFTQSPKVQCRIVAGSKHARSAVATHALFTR